LRRPTKNSLPNLAPFRTDRNLHSGRFMEVPVPLQTAALAALLV
jgi:hypothetical protein